MSQVVRLSTICKICYAIGGIPQQLTACVLAFFLQIYLLFTVKMNPSDVAIVLFVGRVWDAFTDPLVGWLVAQTPQTRFGRLIPWLAASTPPTAIAYIAIWVNPGSHMVLYHTAVYCLFQTCQTCFHIPYSALTLSLSAVQADRDSVTAYRMTAEVIGMLIGTILQGSVVGSAVECREVANETTAAARAYMHAAMGGGILHILCTAILIAGVGVDNGARCKPTLKDYKLVVTHKPYVILVLGFLFTSMAYMLIQGNFALLCSQTMGYKTNCQPIMFVIILASAVAIPFWQWILRYYGKKKTVYVGLLSGIPCIIAMVCVENLIVYYMVAAGAGFGIAAAFLLPWSMLPDIIDEFKKKHKQDCEVLFYSLYILFIKLAVGVAMAASTLSLDSAGYVSGSCHQPASVDRVLKVLLSVGPVVLIVVGLLIIGLYPSRPPVESEMVV